MDVAEELEKDLDWRQAELVSLKVRVATSASGSARQRGLLRALVAMLYAHFEGFCRFAWEVYLDRLEHSGGARSDFTEPLVLFSLAKRFGSLKGQCSDNDLWTFFRSELGSLLAQRMSFEKRFDESTNLWPDTVRENSTRVGLTVKELGNHDVALRALVGMRNQIAHGRKLYVTSLSQYEAYEDAAFAVMYDLAIEIVDVMDSGGYLAVP